MLVPRQVAGGGTRIGIWQGQSMRECIEPPDGRARFVVEPSALNSISRSLATFAVGDFKPARTRAREEAVALSERRHIPSRVLPAQHRASRIRLRK